MSKVEPSVIPGNWDLKDPESIPLYNASLGHAYDMFPTKEEAENALRLYQSPECVKVIENTIHLSKTVIAGSLIEYNSPELAQRACISIRKALGLPPVEETQMYFFKFSLHAVEPMDHKMQEAGVLMAADIDTAYELATKEMISTAIKSGSTIVNDLLYPCSASVEVALIVPSQKEGILEKEATMAGEIDSNNPLWETEREAFLKYWMIKHEKRNKVLF